jgi:hypothetical protein
MRRALSRRLAVAGLGLVAFTTACPPPPGYFWRHEHREERRHDRHERGDHHERHDDHGERHDHGDRHERHG